MKKLVSALLIACMVMGLAACGGKEQSATYHAVQENSGLTIDDTMTLQAKGDKVQEMDENLVIDMSSFEDADCEQLAVIYDQLVEQYKAVEGVECTGSYADKVYTMNITIDATGDAVSQLAEQGLLQVDGNANGISLKKTGEALESSGYEKVE